MKLLIVNNHMDTGGIRQSLLNLLDNISDLNIDIELQLIKYDNKLIEQFEQLKKIKVLPPIRITNVYNTVLSKQKCFTDKILKVFLACLAKLLGRKKVSDFMISLLPRTKHYDIAISYSNDIWTSYVGGFNGGCNDYVVKKVNADRKIGWIHNEPQKLGFTHDICKKTYAGFDTLVSVSFACKKMMDEIIPEYSFKSKVVYNMFNIKRILNLSDMESPYERDIFNIVTVARLDNQQKRIDRIIYCCDSLKKGGLTGFKWYIIGDGPDCDMLKSLSDNMGTNDVILFEGKRDNPYPYMKYADLFVLTSEYEAYGMVLTESLITGTPVISTDFSASREVVQDGENGVIIQKDTDCLLNTVKTYIQRPEAVVQMREFIKSNQFSNETARKQLMDLIGESINA